MTPRPILALGLATTALVALPTPAHAASTGTTEHTCRFSSGLVNDTATLAITLDDVPTSASPGQSLALRGTATLTLGASGSTAVRSSLASSADLTSDAVSVTMTAGDVKRPLRISSLTATATTASSPIVFTGRVALPVVVVPDDVSTLKLATTSDAAITNPLMTGPDNVVLTATMTPKGGLGQARTLACWGGESATIASIAVSSPGTPVAGGALGSGSAPMAGGGLGAAPAPAAGAVGGLPAAAAEVPAASPAGAAPAGTTTLASAPIPPATRTGDVFVPTWLMILLGILLPAAAVAYVRILRRRLVRLRALGGAPA